LAKKREEKQPREYTKRQLSHFKKQQRRQKIILFSGISVIVVVVLIILSGWFFGEFYPMNKTIATVHDAKIKESDFIDAMEILGINQVAYGQTLDLSSQADYILNAMVQNELTIQAAEKLGITVSDEEVDEQIANMPYADSKIGRAMFRASLLASKMQSGYFSDMVGDSAEQVLMNTMMVESNELVSELRERLAHGESFTALAEEYATNTVSKNNKGVFDWHPAAVLRSDLNNPIPVDWAFGADVVAGDISPALSDNSTYKQLGYWLIKVTYRGEGEADTETLLVSSEALAEYLKPLLETADDISALADEYSQYGPSKSGHGQLYTTDTDNISDAFNGYVFNPDTPLDVWSDPIKETHYWTRGGAWIVQVVDKEANRTLSEDDKKELVANAYNDWTSSLWDDAVVYSMDDNQKQWAIEKATKRISEITGS